MLAAARVVRATVRTTVLVRRAGTRAASTAAPKTQLVDAAWLSNRLGSDGVVVLDATWYMDAASAPEHYKCVPGARLWDLNATSDPEEKVLPHMLPSNAQFSQFVEDVGVSATDTVVVYDAQGMFSAARCWWMFRGFNFPDVRILDGGLPAWAALPGPLATEPAAGPFRLAGPRFEARLDTSLVVDKDEVLNCVMKRQGGSTDTAIVVDARGAGRFKGMEPEPRPNTRRGHMPTAVNVPYPSLLDPTTKRFRPVDELRRTFDAAGVPWQGNEPVITSCGSGVTACVVAFALQLCGKDMSSVKLYDGSWAEWGPLPDTYPVEADSS